MKITATNKTLRVDFRLAGKFYEGQVPEGRAPENTSERSDFAFDSTELLPGHSLELGPDDTLVRVTELGQAPVGEENPYLGG